jgi:hypothetical protein
MREMTHGQYRALLKTLGWSQTKVGPLFGYTSRAGQKWASKTGKTPVPRPIALLVRLMAKHGLEHPDQLFELVAPATFKKRPKAKKAAKKAAKRA